MLGILLRRQVVSDRAGLPSPAHRTWTHRAATAALGSALTWRNRRPPGELSPEIGARVPGSTYNPRGAVGARGPGLRFSSRSLARARPRLPPSRSTPAPRPPASGGPLPTPVRGEEHRGGQSVSRGEAAPHPSKEKDARIRCRRLSLPLARRDRFRLYPVSGSLGFRFVGRRDRVPQGSVLEPAKPLRAEAREKPPS